MKKNCRSIFGQNWTTRTTCELFFQVSRKKFFFAQICFLIMFSKIFFFKFLKKICSRFLKSIIKMVLNKKIYFRPKIVKKNFRDYQDRMYSGQPIDSQSMVKKNFEISLTCLKTKSDFFCSKTFFHN